MLRDEKEAKKQTTILKLTALLLIAVVPSTTLAFQKEQPFSIGDARRTAIEGEKSYGDLKAPDLAPTRLELLTKNNLIEMKLKDPKKFEEVRKNRLENSLLYQSWVDEVDEALSERPLPKKLTLQKNDNLVQKFFNGTKIDLAKRIAKKQMFLALQRNWPFLKDTIFNEFDADVWRRPAKLKKDADAPLENLAPGGADVAVQKLNELFHFAPNHSNGANFDFDFDFGGRNFVEIDRRALKHGRVALDINSDHDVNRLEPGAEKIQADNEDGGGNGGTNGPNSAADNTPLDTPSNGGGE